MKGNPARGAGYLARGFGMLTQPGLRTFVIVPLVINVLLFAGAIWFLFEQFSVWVDYLIGQVLPDWEWLDFLRYLLWPLMAFLVLAVVYYSFSLVANFIAAPFNGLLSERVEQRQRGELIVNDGWKELVAMIPRALARELAKMAYYLPRVIGLLILSFIPVINLAAPVLWFLFGAWMLAIQYCDYPMDNNKVSFNDMRRLLAEQRLTSTGFGALVQVGMLVPVLNLILMPAAVIGATLYWVEEYAPATGAQLKTSRD